MKILIAEDDPVSRKILEATLIKCGYEVVVTSDGKEALEALKAADGAPKLAVIDWTMPEMDGLEVCRKVRESGNKKYVYIILVTAREGKQNLVQGMDAGADDYMVKPYDPDELKVRLRAARRILDLQEIFLANEEILKDKAMHDPLTGLWNRGGIMEIFERELKRGSREKKSVGVIMADLDLFKAVNDTYGHIAGDAILRGVARRINSSIRSYDAAGRYGGEEFLCVLPGSNDQSAMEIAQRIRKAIEKKLFDTSEGIISITLSLGATTYSEGREPDMESLIRQADTALYRAKRNGRNRVEMFVADENILQQPEKTKK